MISFVTNLLNKKNLVGRLRAIGVIIRYPLREWMYFIANNKFALKVVGRTELFDNDKYRIRHFGCEEYLIVSAPDRNSGKLPSFIQKEIGKLRTWKQPLVFEVADAELVSSAAVGFDREGNLIADTSNPKNLARTLPAIALLLKHLPQWKIPQQDTVFSLVSGHKNYFHWVTECLTRIEGLEYYQAQTGNKPTLIVDTNPTQWQIESLKLLGYEVDNCLRWNWSKLKVKQLVVSSFRRERIISPETCKWLRDRILENLPDSDSTQSLSPKVYISRPKTAGRRVANEDEVLAALMPLGFVAYTLENLSFADQVRLFSQAEIIIATHGAALTNILFAQNLSVIEIFGSFGESYYFLLAKALGFQYGCLQSSDRIGNLANEKYSNLIVDATELKALASDMLSHSNRLKSVTSYQ